MQDESTLLTVARDHWCNLRDEICRTKRTQREWRGEGMVILQ